jgi:two-component system, LytTR family, sensor kinase
MKKSVVVSIHIFFWIVIYVTTYIIYRTLLKSPFPPVGYHPLWNFEALSFLTLIGISIPFYTSFFLLPKIIENKRKYIWYLIAIVFLFFYPAFTTTFLDNFETIGVANYLNSFVFYLFFSFVGGLFWAFFKWLEQNKQRDNLEKENLKSELTLLKYQINPHFLFNTLNNVDSLMHEDVRKASTALNKLSEIMRYMIYDSEKETVSLKEELAYIESYISLQKLRIINDNKISFNITGDISNIKIAPMLFITFVENAFKHSSLKKTDNSIIIKLDVLENQVNFSCINSLSSSPAEKDESRGIGLELIKKRLELIYPKAYELKIDKTEQSFAVYLKIKTNAN